VLHEALKKLRVLAATENPSEYNKVRILYCVMKYKNFAEFARIGGTEVSDCCEHIVVVHSLRTSASLPASSSAASQLCPTDSELFFLLRSWL